MARRNTMVEAAKPWRILLISATILLGIGPARSMRSVVADDPTGPASHDFGGMTSLEPYAFIQPSGRDDVVKIVERASGSPDLTVAARGNGHSLNGQAMAERGLVIDMQTVDHGHFQIVNMSGATYAEVSGGALWQDVLRLSLAQGWSPRCFTDYLGLTVGGTISNAGMGGHAFRYGPQALNVGQLEVVTGTGEVVVCSKDQNPDLFNGVLGGLGQFGIITKAWILLQPAPDMARWIRVMYAEFEAFSHDAESVITRPEGDTFNYVEGFVIANKDDPINGWPSVPMDPKTRFDPSLIPATAGTVLYCMELTVHYKSSDDPQTVDNLVKRLLGDLKYIQGLEFQMDVKYEDFLLRVNVEAERSKAAGTWQAPHPWLNMFISSENIADLDRMVFKTLLKDGVGGRILTYPFLRSRWGTGTSLVLPEGQGDIVYAVSVLRFSLPYPKGPPLEELIAQNKEILQICDKNGFHYKLYLSNFQSQQEWMAHFGNQWTTFANRKAMFDPKGILHLGNISSRDQHRFRTQSLYVLF